MQFHIVLGLISADGKWHVCTQGRLQHHLRSISPPCSVLTKVSAYAMQLFQKSQPEGRMAGVWPTRAFFDGSNRQFRRGERQRGGNKDFLFMCLSHFWFNTICFVYIYKLDQCGTYFLRMTQCSLYLPLRLGMGNIESYLSLTLRVVHLWVCCVRTLVVYLRSCLTFPRMYILSNWSSIIIWSLDWQSAVRRSPAAVRQKPLVQCPFQLPIDNNGDSVFRIRHSTYGKKSEIERFQGITL